jgi:hypothetical protein
MIRIVGILCGSAIAIAVMIIALGMPKFMPESDDPVPPPLADVVEELPAAAVNIVEPDAANSPTQPPESVPAVIPETVAESEPMAEPEPEFQPEATPPAENWFAFWSPFRSELAANGFISQLQRTTGLDYRVVRLKPGAYEVAFAYDAASDIAPKLAAISAATGLEMPDG